jgi:uncharacterized coiled-coil protein SlyX
MIEELNEALFLQQKKIDELEKQLSFFKNQFMSDGLVEKREDKDSLPPHY